MDGDKTEISWRHLSNPLIIFLRYRQWGFLGMSLVSVACLYLVSLVGGSYFSPAGQPSYPVGRTPVATEICLKDMMTEAWYLLSELLFLF